MSFGLVNSAYWKFFLSLKSWAFRDRKTKEIVSFAEKIKTVRRIAIEEPLEDGDGVPVNSSLKVLSAKHPELTSVKLSIGGSNPRKGLEIILSCPNLTACNLSVTTAKITDIRLPAKKSNLKSLAFSSGPGVSDKCLAKIVRRWGPTLEYLDLKDNNGNINSAVKYVAGNCSNLTTLCVRQHDLKDETVAGLLANCPNLRDILIGSTQMLSRKGRVDLAKLFNRMSVIKLEFGQGLEQVLPEVTSQLFDLCCRLEHLNIQPRINREKIADIARMNPQLKTLDASFDWQVDNGETDGVLAEFFGTLTDNCPDIESLKLHLAEASLNCKDGDPEVVTPCLKLKKVMMYDYTKLFSSGIKLLSRCAPNIEYLELGRYGENIYTYWPDLFILIQEFKYLKTLSFSGPDENMEVVPVLDSISELECLQLLEPGLSPEAMKALLLKCPRLSQLKLDDSLHFDKDVLATIIEYGLSLKCLVIRQTFGGWFDLGSDELAALGGLKSLVELFTPSSCKRLKEILIRELPNLKKYNNEPVNRINI